MEGDTENLSPRASVGAFALDGQSVQSRGSRASSGGHKSAKKRGQEELAGQGPLKRRKNGSGDLAADPDCKDGNGGSGPLTTSDHSDASAAEQCAQDAAAPGRLSASNGFPARAPEQGLPVSPASSLRDGKPPGPAHPADDAANPGGGTAEAPEQTAPKRPSDSTGGVASDSAPSFKDVAAGGDDPQTWNGKQYRLRTSRKRPSRYTDETSDGEGNSEGDADAETLERMLLDASLCESIMESAKVHAAATAEQICICLAMQPFAPADRARLDSLRRIYRKCHVVSVSQYCPEKEDLMALPENFGHFTTNFKHQRSVQKRLKPLIMCLRRHNPSAPIEVFFDFFWLENNCFDNLYGTHWIESAYQFCCSGASRVILPVDGGSCNPNSRCVERMLQHANYSAMGGLRISGLGLEKCPLAVATMRSGLASALTDRGGWRFQAKSYLQNDCPFVEFMLLHRKFPRAVGILEQREKDRPPKQSYRRRRNKVLLRCVPKDAAAVVKVDRFTIVPVSVAIKKRDISTVRLPWYGTRTSPRKR